MVLGSVFRNITENFLTGIFLSLQRPFETGDLIKVAVEIGCVQHEIGCVQQLNVRSTVLMTLEGNVVQVPNATMYRETLRNFTTGPNRQEQFIVGIGYDDAIDEAQEVARRVLVAHPAVLHEPEPLVLADNLGKATVDMKVYFWLNGNKHSAIKVRSSAIRLVKRAFQQHGISMPDEACGIVFPESVPVMMVEEKQAAAPVASSVNAAPPVGSDDNVSMKAEAGLTSDASTLREQARRAKPEEKGEDLLNKESSRVSPPL